MIDNMGMYQGYSVEGTAELKVTPDGADMAMPYAQSCNTVKGCVMNPVYECPTERCVHRQIVHEVPQE